MTKKICTIFLVFFYFIPMKAQPYLNENCAWYEFHGDTFEGILLISKLWLQGDTVVNGNQYWKLYHMADIYNWGTLTNQINYWSLIREEDGAFYEWLPSGDRFIISFDWQVGDTILATGGGLTEVVASIETFEIAGEQRKKFITQWGNEIYEGIGTNQGLLGGLDFLGEEAFGVLQCFSYSGETIQLSTQTFGFEQIEPCDSVYMTSAESMPYPTNSFSIFPNPTNAKFHVTSSNDLEQATYKIFDINGTLQELSIKSIQANNIEIDFNPKTPIGIYFLSIEMNNGKVHWEKVVKQ